MATDPENILSLVGIPISTSQNVHLRNEDEEEDDESPFATEKDFIFLDGDENDNDDGSLGLNDDESQEV